MALLLVFGQGAFSACAARRQAQKRQDQLNEQVADFHKNLRWKRVPQAASHVDPEERADFLERYGDSTDVLNIESIVIESLAYGKPGQAPDEVTTATVFVLRREIEIPDVTLRKVRKVEHWRYEHGVWVLEKGY